MHDPFGPLFPLRFGPPLGPDLCQDRPLRPKTDLSGTKTPQDRQLRPQEHPKTANISPKTTNIGSKSSSRPTPRPQIALPLEK